MPTNVTAEYKAAEAAYKKARDPGERLSLLKDMLRLIPKHKGTDHVQADIKSKIKELTDELTGPKKGAARGGPPTVIRPDGAAQIALIGPPNSGKSALHAVLTGSHAVSEPFPFATQYPQPGMMPFEDIAFQLVDLPSLSPEHPIPWIGNALHPADAAWLVVDLDAPDCIEGVAVGLDMLAERRVHLTTGAAVENEDDPFAVYIPTLLVVTKADLLADPDAEIDAFLDLCGLPFDAAAVSAATGSGLKALGSTMFERLEVIRVYTKIPGLAPDMTRPFTLLGTGTVGDVAALVHKDIAKSLKFARVWDAEYQGRQVGKDHPVADGDVLELHD